MSGTTLLVEIDNQTAQEVRLIDFSDMSDNQLIEPEESSQLETNLPYAESADAFSTHHIDLEIEENDMVYSIWTDHSHVYYSEEGRWAPDAKIVPGLKNAAGEKVKIRITKSGILGELAP